MLVTHELTAHGEHHRALSIERVSPTSAIRSITRNFQITSLGRFGGDGAENVNVHLRVGQSVGTMVAVSGVRCPRSQGQSGLTFDFPHCRVKFAISTDRQRPNYPLL